MVVLLSDPRVALVPVVPLDDPVVPFPAVIGRTVAGSSQGSVRLRRGLACRLIAAADTLPADVSLKIVAGYRTPHDQLAIIADYTATLRRAHPELDRSEIARLSSRFVAPLQVAPHVAGAAIDITLVDADGRELDMGTVVDATPEQSDGACYFAADAIPDAARANRRLLAEVLGAQGFANYPTEWWHWSYGDRYWALATGAAHAFYDAWHEQEVAA